MKVPQTGSFFSSPPVGTGGRLACCSPELNSSPNPFRMTPITDRSKLIISTVAIRYRIARNIYSFLRLLLGSLLLGAGLRELGLYAAADGLQHGLGRFGILAGGAKLQVFLKFFLSAGRRGNLAVGRRGRLSQ